MEKKSGKKMKKNIKAFANYYILFLVTIIYCELLMRLQMGNGIKAANLHFLWFVPAEALFFSFFCGFLKEKINRIATPVVVFVVCIYYIVQMIYYRNFSSLLSVSLTGMGGDAVGNFGWAVKDTIVSSIGLIILMLLPVIVSIVLSVINKPKWKKYSPLGHAIALFAVVALWFLGILGLRIEGSDKQSAYYLFFNTLADTDTVSTKFGAMTTTILECGSYYFGIGLDQTNLAAVNVGDTMLGKPAASTNAVKAVSGDENTVSENEEVFVPVPRVNEAIDFNALKSVASNDITSSMCDFFASRNYTSTNAMTGYFKDYNVIYICAEAFSVYALDENVTPTLYKMAHNGIILNNFYNSFKNTTTNGEYAFATSLWPDVSRQATCGTDVGSFPQSATKFMPQGFADIVNPQGYESFAYHNYYGEYYRRSLSWPNLGYKNIKFNGKGMKFVYSWPASDYEMMQQSVDDYINCEKPFHAYYMTFSGHGPYSAGNHIYNKNIEGVNANIGDRKNELTNEALGYLAGNRELDTAMEYLLSRLEEAGKLDNTLIVIIGDHYPYYMADASVNSLAGHELEKNFEMYKSTCIMYNAGMETPIETDTYCCNVDILPTVLNLLGMDYDSRLYMGTDIFDDTAVHKATIYNLNFITDLVKYNSATGEAEWSEDASAYTQDELDRYLTAMISLVEGEYEASTNIINNNFYKFIWENSGLMTAEESQAEDSRAAQVKAEAESINYKNAEANAEAAAAEKAEQDASKQAESAANGWVYDPNTGYSYDPTNGDIYNPDTGQKVGNMTQINEAKQANQAAPEAQAE